MLVRYNPSDPETELMRIQVAGTDDPADYLQTERIYRVDDVEVCSYHTEYLIQGHWFNETHFEKVEE